MRGGIEMKWLFIVMMYPLELILFGVLYAQRKFRKNIFAGVTLPYTHQSDPFVIGAQAGYAKAQKFGLLLNTLLLVPAAFLNSTISLAYSMIWILFPMAIHFGIFAYYHRKMRDWKKENVVRHETASEEAERITVEPAERIHPYLFIFPVLLAWVPVVRFALAREDAVIILTAAISAALPLLMVWIYYGFFRQKREFFADDTLSLTLYRLREKYWSKITVLMVWAMVLLSLANLWIVSSIPFFIIGVTVLSFVLLGLVLYIELRVLKLQRELTKDVPTALYDDEDEHWLFGMMYYNPKDRTILKNERVGIGQALNLATKTGKVLMGISVLALLRVPFISGYIVYEEMTPVSLEVVDSQLIARHTGVEYTVPLDEIKSVTLPTDLPKMRKVVGSGLDSVYKGRFRNSEYGTMMINLDPRTGPYLLIRTSETTYVLNSADPSETRAVYEQLPNKKTP